MKKKILLIVALLLAGSLQLLPSGRSNPPETDPLTLPDPVNRVFQKACQDCHSNRTEWPWYSRVAPVSWWIVDHVKEGREHLNLSESGALSAGDLEELKEEVVEEVVEGEMPPASYLLMHPEAKLSSQDISALRSWAGSRGAESDHHIK